MKFCIGDLLKYFEKIQVWFKSEKGSLHEEGSRFYIVVNDIRSSTIQKRTYYYLSMAPVLVFVSSFAAKIIRAKWRDSRAF